MFKVETWIPESKKEGTELVKVSQIDAMERDFFEEYEKVMKKDKANNKDFNMKAFD